MGSGSRGSPVQGRSERPGSFRRLWQLHGASSTQCFGQGKCYEIIERIGAAALQHGGNLGLSWADVSIDKVVRVGR